MQRQHISNKLGMRALIAVMLCFFVCVVPSYAQSASALADAKAKPEALSSSNGPFHADMILITPENLSELHKPSDQLPIMRIVSEAKVGDIVVAVFLFTGMEADKDNNIDVTWDLKIFSPDGTIYDNTDLRNETAVRTKLTHPQMIMHNQGKYAGIRFEAKDQKGLYLFEGMLHDNIGKRDIPLAALIELKP